MFTKRCARISFLHLIVAMVLPVGAVIAFIRIAGAFPAPHSLTNTPAAVIDCSFVDNFSDPASGWLLFDVPGQVRAWYEDDQFKMNIHSGRFASVNTRTLCSNVSIDVDTTVISYTADQSYAAAYGIAFGYRDYRNYYFFSVHPLDGMYKVMRIQNGSFEDIVEWTQSDLINTGLTDNHLRVELVGEQVSLYVNRRHLVTFSEPNFPTGSAGFALYAGYQQMTEVAFDNFVQAPIAPTLQIDHAAGAPGSVFVVTGSGYPPNSTATIQINGVLLPNHVSVDAMGLFEFQLDAAEANEGWYMVTASVNPSASAVFAVDATAPLYQPDSTGPKIDIPQGIALTHAVFLPTIVTR